MPVDLPYRIAALSRGLIWLCRIELLILLGLAALEVGIWLHFLPVGMLTETALTKTTRGLMVAGAAGAGLVLLLFLFWQHHAVANAQALIPDRRRITPGWAVIWWVIPVLNIIQPIRSISQTWNTSVDNARNPNGPAAPAVTGWWLFLLISPVPVLLSADKGPLAIAIGVALFAASVLALITIVRSVSKAQAVASMERTPVEPEPAVTEPVMP